MDKRNLSLRLRDYEADVLRFLLDPRVPFTNNQGERDIRMSKVQQKNIRLLLFNGRRLYVLFNPFVLIDLP